ncbi:unnamed protein product [Mytilus edulis]|uniref:Double jelly roll-like domain-containing protein n=1 Tax=Mytilus edulis TaxID=6550 RepID=A0A8S3QVV7_MYTED|nr:unnamed protein product [Mytilus edulis]
MLEIELEEGRLVDIKNEKEYLLQLHLRGIIHPIFNTQHWMDRCDGCSADQYFGQYTETYDKGCSDKECNGRRVIEKSDICLSCIRRHMGEFESVKCSFDYNAAFNENRIARVFKEASDFRKKFHNMDTLLSNGGINPSDFIDLYPLFVIDVSHQSERLKESTVDIQIRAEFARNVPANTEAFALVISDRILQFESDGQKMNVVAANC